MGSRDEFNLPMVDMSLFISGNRLERSRFADQLRDSLVKHGFVKVINHGISDSEVEEVFDWSEKFFQLPIDVKNQIVHLPSSNPQRGWSKVGSESTAKLFGALSKSGEKIDKTDLKEHFDIGAVNESAFPNKWVSESHMPGFRSFLEDFYERCHVISMQLLEALAISLAQPAGTFTDMCEQKANELRLIHYPPTKHSSTASDLNRVWPHTDLGIITCLFQDNVGGLEIEDRDRRIFQPVIPGRRSELIVNISETMHRWSNGKIPAGIHQVTLPSGYVSKSITDNEIAVPERYSIPYFVKADQNAHVGPLSHFVDDSSPPKFPNMTALEFQMQRLSQAY
ncbi:hypothetical protein BKA67DRAFT_539186 [Truncatella angustata]|uniref:Fe2OG dioxygenase domain-containing protein n=1 Tax=Truncatella angustata TaxID=152316 RepID=A0A9P8UG07_9PEZI|nr:uncharacterized protein BKA67DRAFT_539186 [Truncatella angustata]KAH6649195.1 hypothetical protein BKA67DRAFT_539186 [Truncatella angustata]